MTTSLKQAAVEFQRRCMIDLLAADPADAINTHILRDALAQFGQDVRADEMAALADWLAEAGLAEFVHKGPPLVLRVTARGEDVAAGRIHIDGVARPLR